MQYRIIQVLTSVPALGRESPVIWPCVLLQAASFTAPCVMSGLAKRWNSGSIQRASNIKARCLNNDTGMRWRIWATYSDCHIQIEQLVLLLLAFCQHALLCGSFDMSTFLCLMLIHVTCSGTIRYQNWGRKRICLSLDAFSGQLC